MKSMPSSAGAATAARHRFDTFSSVRGTEMPALGDAGRPRERHFIFWQRNECSHPHDLETNARTERGPARAAIQARRPRRLEPSCSPVRRFAHLGLWSSAAHARTAWRCSAHARGQRTRKRCLAWLNGTHAPRRLSSAFSLVRGLFRAVSRKRVSANLRASSLHDAQAHVACPEVGLRVWAECATSREAPGVGLPAGLGPAAPPAALAAKPRPVDRAGGRGRSGGFPGVRRPRGSESAGPARSLGSLTPDATRLGAPPSESPVPPWVSARPGLAVSDSRPERRAALPAQQSPMVRIIVMTISLITAGRAFTGALARRASPLRKRTARFASHPVSMRSDVAAF